MTWQDAHVSVEAVPDEPEPTRRVAQNPEEVKAFFRKHGMMGRG
jgi:hypothetical protein